MKFVQAKSCSKGNRGPGDITLVTIHTMEAPEGDATAENVAAWFAGANAPQASAHYNVDGNSVVQSVLEKDVAWHAGPVNGYSIGVEHAGYAKQTPDEWADSFSLAMLEQSAALVGDICHRYAIPVVRLTADELKSGKRHGICGHVDVTDGLTGGKGHYDPGPHFPYDWYLERVAAHVERAKSPPATPNEDGAWPIVECDGVRWIVAPSYIAPIGIGQADDMARAFGWELPTPELVDAIWRAADLRIAPITRSVDNGLLMDWGTSMSSLATFNDQAERIEKAIGGRAYTLLAGTHKDVVRKDGVLGIYGMHRLDGSVIQSFYDKHARGWIDYSQGFRFVKRAIAIDIAT